MDIQRLRAFDNQAITYTARLKEIWISEKYRRGKYLRRDGGVRADLYEDLADQVRGLVGDLENTRFNDSELLDCREQYLNAGRALIGAYEELKSKELAEEQLKDFAYYLDNAGVELNRLWKKYGNRR